MAALRFDSEQAYATFLATYQGRDKRPQRAPGGPISAGGGGRPVDAAVRLLQAIVAEKLPGVWYREFTFHESRGWRIDVASPWGRYNIGGGYDAGEGHQMGLGYNHGRGGIGIEIDGGVHRIKDKWVRDIGKWNALVIAGWRVIRCTPTQVDNGEALTLLKALLQETRS